MPRHAAAGSPDKDTVLLHEERQIIDNFAASDCWSIQRRGGWSLLNRNRVADLLFSQTDGIGLSCWRFNIGGEESTPKSRTGGQRKHSRLLKVVRLDAAAE